MKFPFSVVICEDVRTVHTEEELVDALRDAAIAERTATPMYNLSTISNRVPRKE